MNIPDGWPTDEMLFAAHEACDDMFQGDFIRAFKAAIEAAPTPPAGYLVTSPSGDTAFFEQLPEILPPGCMVQEQASAQDGPVASILRDICESEPDNPDSPNTVCIDVDALRLILERHIPQSDKLRQAAEEALGVLEYFSVDHRLNSYTKERVEKAEENLRAALEGK